MSRNVLGAIQHACNFLHHSEAKMFLQKLPLLILICGVHNIPLANSSIAIEVANTPAKQNWIQGRFHRHNGRRDGPPRFPGCVRNSKNKE